MEQHETRNALRETRINRGRTVADIARKLGVTTAAVQAWETSKSVPGGPAMRLLAMELGVSLDLVEFWFSGAKERNAA